MVDLLSAFLEVIGKSERKEWGRGFGLQVCLLVTGVSAVLVLIVLMFV